MRFVMLAYAANRSLAGNRHSSPNALLLIVGAHVALIAAVMSAKMDLPARIPRGPPVIRIPIEPAPPPPHRLNRPPPSREQTSQILIDRGPLVGPQQLGKPPAGGDNFGPGSIIAGSGTNVIPLLPKP